MCWPAICSGSPLKPEQSSKCRSPPTRSSTGRLGWEIVAPLMDRASPLRTTHLRDPYGPPILFGSESFMDEVAAATETDPVDFRLRYLTNPRDRDAVRIAAEHYGWEKRPSPRNDQKDADSRSAAALLSGGTSTPSSRWSPKCGCTARPARSSSCAMSARTIAA